MRIVEITATTVALNSTLRNAAFDRARALACAKALAPCELRWFEEPCDPLDCALLTDVQPPLSA